jgi:hypothetical protein
VYQGFFRFLAASPFNTMAIDIGNVNNRSTLWSALRKSRDSMDMFDQFRTSMINDFAGPLYSPFKPKGWTARYVNSLNRTARVYQTLLAYNNPQCRVTSFQQKLWPFAKKYEINVNRVAANINLNATLQELVLDAFFLVGAAKVRMADDGYREIEDNVWLDPGKPWVDRISWSDIFLDMPAKSLRSMRFYGDRYRASYDAVMKRDDFDEKVLKKLSPSSKKNQNATAERGDDILLQNSVDDDELEPMCWLIDLYLPRERQFITMSADMDELPPLKVQDWDGSDQGPYKFLGFGSVPDNVMPTTPAQQLTLLDRLMNRLYLKLSNQAKRQKNFAMVPQGQEKDGIKIKDAVDGEYIVVADPKAVVPVNYPGVDGNTHAFFLAAAEVYNTQAGNERALSGSGEEAGTLGQEQIIAAHAGGLIGFIKGQVNAFASEIMREIGCLMWDDESLSVSSSMEAENTGYYVDTSWKPGERQGLKDHYDFSVEPNSMAYRPPEAKLQVINQFAQTYLQMMPAIQAGIFDGMEYARTYAENTNTPEILRFVKQLQDGAQGGGDPHEATKAPSTTREVVRRSANTGPRGAGKQQVLSQMMQGRGQGQTTVGAGT